MECPMLWQEAGAPSGKQGSWWPDGELLHAEKRLATRSRLVHVRPHRPVGPEHRGAAAPAASPWFLLGLILRGIRDGGRLGRPFATMLLSSSIRPCLKDSPPLHSPRHLRKSLTGFVRVDPVTAAVWSGPRLRVSGGGIAHGS